MLKQFLETGEITGTHGVRGEVRVHPWSDSPEFLLKFKKFYLDVAGSTEIKVSSSRVHGNMVLVKFCGTDSIEQAEKLRGKVLYINRNDVDLEGRSFIQDIIGCMAYDADNGQKLGEIVDVITGIANDVWCIEQNGKQYLVPAIDSVVIEKQLEQGIVKLRVMKGIFDDED